MKLKTNMLLFFFSCKLKNKRHSSCFLHYEPQLDDLRSCRESHKVSLLPWNIKMHQHCHTIVAFLNYEYIICLSDNHILYSQSILSWSIKWTYTWDGFLRILWFLRHVYYNKCFTFLILIKQLFRFNTATVVIAGMRLHPANNCITNSSVAMVWKFSFHNIQKTSLNLTSYTI